MYSYRDCILDLLIILKKIDLGFVIQYLSHESHFQSLVQ